MKIVEKAGEKTTLLFDQEELRAVHGALRESLEVVESCVFESRMEASEAEVTRIMGEFGLVHRRWGRRKRVSVSEEELVAIRNALTASLEIEDWEFPTRMGFTKEEVRKLLAEVSALVSI